MALEQSIRLIWGMVGGIVVIIGLALWAATHRQPRPTRPNASTGMLMIGAVVLGLGLVAGFLAGERPAHDAPPSYPERLGKVLATVQRTSHEVDDVLTEAGQHKESRLLEVNALYAQLETLEQEEATLRKRIEVLQNLDPEEIKFLLQEVEEKEDGGLSGYGGFVAGAASVALLSVVLRYLRII